MTPPLSSLPPIAKLHDLIEAARARDALAAEGKRIVLTNGCFDLLHAGHIYFLQQAAELGDALFVAVNSDRSVRALKGPARPIQPENERAYALAALACTHTLVLFDQPRLTTEIRTLRPHVYAKAGDYTIDSLDAGERAALAGVGTEIRILPYLQGFGTTALLKRIAVAAKLD